MGFYFCGGRGIREKDIKRVLVNNMCVCVCVCVCVNGQTLLCMQKIISTHCNAVFVVVVVVCGVKNT